MKKRIEIVTCGLIVVLASLLFLTGCGKKEETAKETPKPAETATAPAAKPAIPEAGKLTEQSMTEDIQASAANLVKTENPSFESWDKNSPANWLIRDHHKVAQSSDASEGKIAVEIPATIKDVNYVYQNSPLNSSLGGKRVVITAMAKSFEAGKALLWGYTVINKVQSETIRGGMHPGDGKWHRIGVSIPLPENISDGKLCYVLESSQSVKPALFDDVKIYTK